MTRAKLIKEVPPTRDGARPGLIPGLSDIVPVIVPLTQEQDRTWDDDCRAADAGPDEWAAWVADLQDAS